MEYNTQRKKIQITDYGRNIYKLIEKAKAIENRERRNAMANTIINVMAQVNPQVKNDVEYKHKLWDHLMLMSNYELDVDCPYPISRENNIDFTPTPLKYQNHRIQYRHYGKVLEDLIEKIADYPEGEEKETLIELVAHQMKKSYLTWNRDTVNDELIFEQFEQLTNGKLKLKDDFQLKSSKEYISLPSNSMALKNNPNKQKKKQKQNHQPNTVKLKNKKK